MKLLDPRDALANFKQLLTVSTQSRFPVAKDAVEKLSDVAARVDAVRIADGTIPNEIASPRTLGARETVEIPRNVEFAVAASAVAGRTTPNPSSVPLRTMQRGVPAGIVALASALLTRTRAWSAEPPPTVLILIDFYHVLSYGVTRVRATLPITACFLRF